MVSSTSTLRSTLIVLANVLATPTALAYAHLIKQSPAANAKMAASPQALALNFSEGVEPGSSGATLTGPNKEQIKTSKASCSEQDKTQLIVPLGQTLEAGKYMVDWHVTSVDGYKTKEQYTFNMK